MSAYTTFRFILQKWVMLNNDVTLEIVKYLSINDTIKIEAFHEILLWKYRNIWKSITKTLYTRQSVTDFLSQQFVFGVFYQKCNNLSDLIEAIVFMIGLTVSTKVKIENSLLLYLGLLELHTNPMRLMVDAMRAIFSDDIVKGFSDVCNGLGEYFVKLLLHRRKKVELKIFQLLFENNIIEIPRYAMEASVLHRMSKQYEIHTNKDSAIE